MLAARQRIDAMEGETGRAAPYDHVAVSKPDPARPMGARGPAPQEGCFGPERHRDNWLIEVPLVAVLVEGQLRAGLVPVDQAGLGRKPLKARRARRTSPNVGKG